MDGPEVGGATAAAQGHPPDPAEEAAMKVLRAVSQLREHASPRALAPARSRRRYLPRSAASFWPAEAEGPLACVWEEGPLVGPR